MVGIKHENHLEDLDSSISRFYFFKRLQTYSNGLHLMHSKYNISNIANRYSHIQFGFWFKTCIKTHVNILFNAASNTDCMIQYTTVKFEYDTGNRKRMTLFLLMVFFNEN